MIPPTYTVPIEYFIFLSGVLFAIGVIGFLIRNNPIIMFMCIELMLSAVNLAFIAFANRLGLIVGQAIVLFVMAVAAAEVTVGLAIIVAIFRTKVVINIDEMNTMKD